MNRAGELRKIRSDKKRDVKPYIPFNLYDCIDRLAYILNCPIKEIAELLCIEGLNSSFVIDCLSTYFVRDYSPANTNTVYVAQSESGSRRIKIKGGKKRVSIRFKQSSYDRLSNLSYAAGLTVASATSLLLIHAFRDVHLINRTIGSGTLDNNRIQERRYVLKKARKGVWQFESYR